MKYKILIAVLAIALYSSAQTADNRNNLSIGFGTQNYNGVLENTWFDFEYETYGASMINYSRYINPSFDFMASTTVGNFGHCRDGDEVYWPDGAVELNMKSMLVTANVTVKYKFANGYIIKEDAKIAPFIYLGAGANPVLDMWTHRVDPGVYLSAVGGVGLRYNITTKFNFTYIMGFGVFNNDKMDYGNLYAPTPMNPMYMQNTYTLGYTF